MTVAEAERTVRNFYGNNNPTEEDEFMFTEAMEYIIDKTHNPEAMMSLGGYYYEREIFELALKYYDMAAEYKHEAAYECLGYIWYYGRTGEKNYEKAFQNFSKAMEMGNITATYKVADMYKNGYYVGKDEEKYKSIIENLYQTVKNMDNAFDPLPEIFTRLAKIRANEGKTEEAVNLYEKAKPYIAVRLSCNSFFGDHTIMKWLIHDLYRLKPFNPADMDFYDLYECLERPCKVTFCYKTENHTVESVYEESGIVICFDGKWFRCKDDFFRKGQIDGKLLSTICRDFYMFLIQE